MSEPLAIPGLEAEPTPKLTARQTAVLAALEAAGEAGLHADEAGAIAHGLKEGRWKHGPDERCVWCGQDGLALLRRLRELGLARYRAKLKAWQPVAIPPVEAEPPPDFEGLRGEYNALPAGF